MGEITYTLLICSIEWGNIFPEDKEAFREALKRVGYILHQYGANEDELIIYKED